MNFGRPDRDRQVFCPDVGRRAGTAGRAAAFVCLLSASVLPTPSAAFDLFGKSLFSRNPVEETAEVPDPTPYTVDLSVAGGGDLLESDLRDVSTLVAEQESPPSGLIGVIARARADRNRFIGALYGAGHYGGTADISVAGLPLDEASLDPERNVPRPVPVIVKIQAGPLFRFGDVAIDIRGEGRQSASDYGLITGEPARSGQVLEAEEQLVAKFRERGYAFARLADQNVLADHKSKTLDVTLILDPGPLVRFGTVTVKGDEKVDADFIRRYADIPVDKTFHPSELVRAEDRLRSLGVFSRITVTPADAPTPDNTVPITITVAESKQRTIGFGATIDSRDGFGVEGYWRHNNLFGRGEQFGAEIEAGRLGNVSSLDTAKLRAAITFAKPGVFGPSTRLDSSLSAEFEEPDAFRRAAVVGKAAIKYDIDEKQSFTGGVEVEYSDIEDSFGKSRHFLVGLPMEFVRDARDDRLDPTTGYRVIAFAEPFYDLKQEIGFARFGGTVAVYQAVDAAKRFILAGKVGGGYIVGASATEIPANRRFYAGGANSVRGYGFQQAGPAAADGSPLGGTTLFESSLEARIRVLQSVQVVPFFDAGGVFDTGRTEFGDSLQYGAGLGIRYATPIGPLRLDVGFPINPGRGDDRFAVYIGLGQAF